MKRISACFIIGLFVLSITSCASLKVRTTIPYKGDHIKKIAIVGSYYGRIKQPRFPLIDASSFNKKTNEISEGIIKYQENILPEYEDLLVQKLSRALEVEIIKPAEFTTEQNLALNKKFPYRSNLGIDHEHYYKLISTSQEINLFPFENGEVLDYFELSSNYFRTIKEISEILEVDAVLISFSRLNVVGVGIFGTTGRVRIDTHVYIFDDEGRTIAKTEAFTKPKNIKGKKIEEYVQVFDEYPIILDLIAKDVNTSKPTK